jgi:homocysteine S-methyltransferase
MAISRPTATTREQDRRARSGANETTTTANSAHASELRERPDSGADWLARVKAIRANASRCSHAELDAETELDRGDVADLAARFVRRQSMPPDLRVVGGCCGTDHEHVTAIADALVGARW